GREPRGRTRRVPLGGRSDGLRKVDLAQRGGGAARSFGGLGSRFRRAAARNQPARRLSLPGRGAHALAERARERRGGAPLPPGRARDRSAIFASICRVRATSRRSGLRLVSPSCTSTSGARCARRCSGHMPRAKAAHRELGPAALLALRVLLLVAIFFLWYGL